MNFKRDLSKNWSQIYKMTHFSQKQEDGVQHIKLIQTMENKNEKTCAKYLETDYPFPL